MHVIGSSLTSVDLSGLTRLELGFALVTVAAAAGLMLALSFADRRRSMAILSALGAGRAQVGAFVWSEAALVLAGGVAFGLATGALIAEILVKLLTGVFDPPPEALVIPWGYGVAIVLAATGATCLVAWLSLTASMRGVTQAIRADQ